MPRDTLCDCPLEGRTSATVERCEAEHDEMICSRPVGHDGPHAACTMTEHPVATWGAE